MILGPTQKLEVADSNSEVGQSCHGQCACTLPKPNPLGAKLLPIAGCSVCVCVRVCVCVCVCGGGGGGGGGEGGRKKKVIAYDDCCFLL